MSPDGALLAPVAAPRPALRLVPRSGLRVADVALFYGERSGGIRTYLDAKRAWTARTGAYEHHVLTPGPHERHDGGRHELPSLRVAMPNGYRVPLGVRALKATLAAIRPDVVLLHDPYWAPLGVTGHAHALGARVVAVHHSSVALNAHGLPAPAWAVAPALRGWFRRAYADVDAVMSAVPTRGDTGRDAAVPLRFGLHPAFRARAGERRGPHVLYAGRLAREKGVFALLDAAAAAHEPYPLHLVGDGPERTRLARHARRLGIAWRVTFGPYVRDPEALRAAYAGARCVVMPGEHETFGLVALEAAASGARVVCCDTAPSAAVVGGLADTFAPGDVAGLARAIDAARHREPDPGRARLLAERASWPAAFAAEHRALRELVAG